MVHAERFSFRLTRRRALGALVATAGAGLLAACMPTVQPAATTAPAATAKPAAAPIGASGTPAAAADQTTGPTPAAAANPAVQPKSGGTLRVGMVGDIARIDGHLLSTVNVSWAPFDRLIE